MENNNKVLIFCLCITYEYILVNVGLYRELFFAPNMNVPVDAKFRINGIDFMLTYFSQ